MGIAGRGNQPRSGDIVEAVIELAAGLLAASVVVAHARAAKDA